VGAHAAVGDEVDLYSVARISIGVGATVSQYSYLCAATHDPDDDERRLIALPINIGPYAWIAADVFVGPGVSVGDRTVVGARSAVFGDLPAQVIATGTPARVRRSRGRQHEDNGGAD
jgi:putative colanic acid biosynthesis acetyltransferase WcaF